MKRVFLFLIIIGFLFSCEKKKTEFIQSKAVKNLVLVKNLPQSPDEAIGIIIEYIKKQKNKDFKEFYEYTSNTEPF